MVSAHLVTLVTLKRVGLIQDFRLSHTPQGWYLQISGIITNLDGFNHVDSDLENCLSYAIRHVLSGLQRKLDNVGGIT